MDHPDTTLIRGGKVVSKMRYEDSLIHEAGLQLGITDDRLWLCLTGHPKKEAPIVGLAFDLLLEVAASKETGINTMQLARNTGQDPRSVTGRIKKFAHLVTATQMVFKGHLVKLLKLNQFVNEKPTKTYINMREHLHNLVAIVKNSKNGVRQIIDLKREMGFDKEKRLSKAFTSGISWLDQQEYLKKVLVVSPSNPSIKIRCVQYLRDYMVEDETSSNSFENDSMDEDEEEDGGHDINADDLDKAALEEEDLLGLEKINATQLLHESNLLIQETSTSRKELSINRFYPMQTQVYSLAERAGVNGLSTMELITNFVGSDYKRCFSKNSEYFIEGTSKKSSAHALSGDSMSLVKIYDFEGKKKFHRIFTKESFSKLTGHEILSDKKNQEAPVYGSQQEKLSELSKMNFVPLNASLRYTNDGTKDIFFWHGELDIPASSQSSVRGRKRIMLPELSKEKPKKIKTGSAEVIPKEEESALVKKHHQITMNGFTGSSLKSIQRQGALLTVLRKSGGVRYIGDQLYDSISREMGSNMILDKKTLKKEYTNLVESGKLRTFDEENTGKRMLCLPETTNEKIQSYIISSKDSRGKFATNVIRKEDIYFFDQTERDKFRRGINSAKRIKEFERKSRKSRDINSNATDKDSSLAKEVPKKRPKSKSSTTVPAKTEIERKEDKNEEPSSACIFHLGNKEGSRALLLAVAITRSIKGQIDWDEITRLFPNNSLENLKKQWTTRRIRMGAAGWRALMDKWRKIMIEAIQDERATLEDAEQMNLPKLVQLWLSVESDGDISIKLYRDYNLNRRKYTFVPVSSKPRAETKGKGLAMSSMIQRENYLLNKIYAMSKLSEEPNASTDDEIRSVVRSMLFEKDASESTDLSILHSFGHEQVDKVILDMARERLLTFLDSSKLQLTESLYEILKYRGDISFSERADSLRKKLVEIFGSKNAVIISEEPQSHVPLVLLQLLDLNQIEIRPVPLEVQHTKMYYTTRQYEVRALTPPLLIYSSRKIHNFQPVKVPIPINKAFSRLWIDGHSGIRGLVWSNIVSMVLREILFSPGITANSLSERFVMILSRIEINEVITWLEQSKKIVSTGCRGYAVSDYWYYDCA